MMAALRFNAADPKFQYSDPKQGPMFKVIELH